METTKHTPEEVANDAINFLIVERDRGDISDNDCIVGVERTLMEFKESIENNNIYQRACEQINKDNPIAVAENLGKLFDLAKLLSGTMVHKGKYFTKAELQRLDQLLVLLTKLTDK